MLSGSYGINDWAQQRETHTEATLTQNNYLNSYRQTLVRTKRANVPFILNEDGMLKLTGNGNLTIDEDMIDNADHRMREYKYFYVNLLKFAE